MSRYYVGVEHTPEQFVLECLLVFIVISGSTQIGRLFHWSFNSR
jgi:hypothetical protein